MTLEELVDYLILNDKRVDAQVNINDAQLIYSTLANRANMRIDLLPLYQTQVSKEEVDDAKR